MVLDGYADSLTVPRANNINTKLSWYKGSKF